jgi:hypothetical protein
MKHIKTFENYGEYGDFTKDNIGDIVTCYDYPSYGYHTLKIGKQYKIVDVINKETYINSEITVTFNEIKVKPVEDDNLKIGAWRDDYDRYYLSVYFLPDDVKKRRIKLRKDAKKYNL